MKTKRSLIIVLLFAIVVMLNPIKAKAADEDAVRSQVTALCKGLQSHNYQKVRKVVRDNHTYFKFKKYDKLIGKSFLKEMGKYIDYKIDDISVSGGTAHVTITFEFCDASNYYYIVSRELFASHKKARNNFAKTFKRIRKQHIESTKNSKNYVRLINGVSTTVNLTFEKKNGKWISDNEEDSTAISNVYTAGYGTFVVVGGDEMSKYMEYAFNHFF